MSGPARPAAATDLVAPPRLTPAQEAAVARVGCAVTDEAGPAGGPVVLLCGPVGVGKTTVLQALAAALFGSCPTEVRAAADWIVPPGRPIGGLPDVVIADDAHESSCGDLLRLVAAVRDRRPQGRLVLAGEGRLLSLVARDVRIERAVGMRAILRPFTLAETQAIVAGMLDAPDGRDATGAGTTVPEAVRRIHEIAAGMPGAITRIAGQAAVLAESRPGRRITPADVELIHGRLSLSAA